MTHRRLGTKIILAVSELMDSECAMKPKEISRQQWELLKNKIAAHLEKSDSVVICASAIFETIGLPIGKLMDLWPSIGHWLNIEDHPFDAVVAQIYEGPPYDIAEVEFKRK